MADHVTAAERTRMRQLHARGMSCNAIAKELGRSPRTISGHCADMGLPFDRAQTAEAVKAHVIDAKARRAELMLDYLDDAARLRAQLWEQYTDHAPVGGMEPRVLTWTRDEPSFADKEKIMRASALSAGTHMKLADFDAGTGADHAKSMLGKLFAGLAQAVTEDADAGAPAGDG